MHSNYYSVIVIPCVTNFSKPSLTEVAMEKNGSCTSHDDDHHDHFRHSLRADQCSRNSILKRGKKPATVRSSKETNPLLLDLIIPWLKLETFQFCRFSLKSTLKGLWEFFYVLNPNTSV